MGEHVRDDLFGTQERANRLSVQTPLKLLCGKIKERAAFCTSSGVCNQELDGAQFIPDTGKNRVDLSLVHAGEVDRADARDVDGIGDGRGRGDRDGSDCKCAGDGCALRGTLEIG